MALIKYKPRTPGTRAVIKVDRSHLYKGGPRLNLTAHQSKTGGRNHFGRSVGRTQDWKKAYVSLSPGQTIDYEARAKT